MAKKLVIPKGLTKDLTIAKKVDEDTYVATLREWREYANRARYLAWNRWNESWRLYNHQYDWSGKAPWQSKNYLNKLPLAVEMGAALVRRAMIDAVEWFRLEGTTATMKKYAPFYEKILYYYFEQLRFVDELSGPLKAGFIGSLIVLKPHLAPYTLEELDEDEVEKQKRGEDVRQDLIEGPALTVSYPDPYNIWLDPTGRDSFVIEEELMDLPLAYDLVDLGVFDGDAVDSAAEEDWVESDKEVREQQRKQQIMDITHPKDRKQLKVTHFWGALPAEDGRGWRIKNGHFAMLNDKYIGRKPMENPYLWRSQPWGKRGPYIIGSPFRRPFSVYHKGLCEDVVGLVKVMTELMNMILDATLFASIPAFEVDLDQIEDPQQILEGIYPAKVFTKRSGGQPNSQMIKNVELAGARPEVQNIYALINKEFQDSTAITGYVSGLDTPANRTATEAVMHQNQGMGIWGEVGRNLENTVLEPFVEMMAFNCVQYHDDFLSEEVVEILGPDASLQLQLMSYEERISTIDPSKMKVKATGVTALLNRQEEAQKVAEFVQGLGQFGQLLPMIMQGFDQQYFFQGLFQKWTQAFGWNPADLFRPPSPEQIAQQQAAAAGGAGPAGSEPAGPPGAAPQPGQPAPPGAAAGPAQLQHITNAIQGGGLPPNGQVNTRRR